MQSNQQTQQKKRKVLLIGWDGADWKFLMPLIDRGLMPNLQKLIEGGTMGRLATLDPPLSPTLWTSIATGKRPYKHGIHGFTEPDPSGEGIRPIYSLNRKCKAIWNILNQNDFRPNVVGWWPSHPAEPIKGVMVSNLYQRARGDLGQPWPMLKGTVHPQDQTPIFEQLRIHPQELTGNHLDPFVPQLEKVDQMLDQRLYGVGKIIAECSSIHSAATYIMDHEDWDFMAVYYDAIDHFCHGFMRYHPPRRPHIPLRDYELYKEVVNSGCRYHDLMLGRLMEMVDEDTTIILISDHGFHPDHNRPVKIPKEPTGPAYEHSPYGIFVMNGPGIKQDESMFGASILDITPTLLQLFDLPVAEDMDGKVLVNAFIKKPKIKTIKSWENIQGEDGSHPKNLVVGKDEAKAELQQLIELGYIEDPGDNPSIAIKSTNDENNYNLARAYIDGHLWAEGIEILEKLYQENPKVFRFAVRLSHAYQNTGQLKKSREVFNHIKTLFERESPQLDLMEATLFMLEERYPAAIQLFEKVEKEAGQLPNINLRLASVYLRLNDLPKAEAAIMKELAVNPEEQVAHFIKGKINFEQMRYEEALGAFLDAVGLLYYQPNTHYYIGETLLALGKYEQAVEAYKTCLQLAPGFNKARLRIISIYKTKLNQAGKAYRYEAEMEQKISGTINIVSGLPRSGTSMMMQMLEAGGLEVFTDKKREADESNPKGYYEHEAVKALKRNTQFLEQAVDKTIKVIAQLITSLPMSYRYRIVFMERDILEVISSQQKMLVREGKKKESDLVSIDLIQQYESTLKKIKKWVEEKPNIEIIYVSYSEVLSQPFLQAMLINDFYDGQLQVEKMVAKVDTTLYREKSLK